MHLRTALSALVVLAAAAGCSSDDDDSSAGTAPVVQLGAPGETNRVLSPEEVAEIEGPAHTAADVAFVQGMIHHHHQALAMTALVGGRTERSDLPLLAERMDVAQNDEIVQLEAWLTQRGEPIPDEHGDHAGGSVGLMPGMLTTDDLAQLEAATGRTFDELFLQYMIRHHEGAASMVAALLGGDDGGQEPAVFQLADGIATDQQVEISRMKHLLAEVAAGR